MMNWEILAQTMPEEINGVPIDAAIITSEENCRYISGFHAPAVHRVYRDGEEFLQCFWLIFDIPQLYSL